MAAKHVPGFTLKIEPELKKPLQKLADSHDRSLYREVIFALRRYVEQEAQEQAHNA